MLEYFADKPYSDGDDTQAILTYIQPPISNVPRLAGYSYPIGNQLYLQTAETLLWYVDYLQVGDIRYGDVRRTELDTQIVLPEYADSILIFSSESQLVEELSTLLNAPFADELRLELTHPETASFWNVMRFVHAGARQREGGGSPEFPGNNQPSLIALRYEERTKEPVGRATSDISTFAIITTVYSDSILLDFTNWDEQNQSIIVSPIDSLRSDGIHRRLSERNKAIQVIEQMGDENRYTNATHIVGSRGLGLQLVTQYENSEGDFLPYTPEEAYYLVSALITEYEQHGIELSRQTLCNAPLLQSGYHMYTEGHSVTNKIEQLCS